MKRILTVCIVCLICLSGFAVPAAADSGVGVSPATITGSLKPGETQNAQITVTLPGGVPKGDVVFAFDTTGSMSLVSEAMKSQGIQVMNDIRTVIPDTQFGVGSFMDYPHDYSNFYGYTNTYGQNDCSTTGPGYANDYAYSLDQDLTPDISLAQAAIQKIPKGCGGDWPEAYTRVIYEAQSYHWRADAKKIYVIFGDAPPHAAPSGATLMKPWAPAEKLFTRPEAPYGGDPGVDEVAGTADDLDYAPVVDSVAASHIAIVGVYCPNGGVLDDQHADAENNFRYMAYMTGGLFEVSDPNGNPSDIAAQIVAMIQDMAKQNIKNLGIQAEEPGYAGWIASPDSFTDVAWPSTETFNVAITPPAGTKTGTYSFHIDIIGDGVVLGTVPVTEQVTANQVVTPLKVSVDVKPGSCPNPLELKDKGVLPVAILGDSTLKVSSIDPKSILLSRDGGTTGAKPVRWSIEDVGSPSTRTCSCGFKAGKDDRKEDLSLKFDTQDVIRKLGITKSDGCLKVYVTGTLKSSDPNTPGQQIQGWDFLQVSDSGHGTCGGADSKDDQGSGSYGGSGNSWGSGNDRGSSDNGGFPGDSDHR